MEDIATILIGVIFFTGGFTILEIGGLSKGIFIDMGIAAKPIGLLCITIGMLVLISYFKRYFKK